jgi:hypothetical protein
MPKQFLAGDGAPPGEMAVPVGMPGVPIPAGVRILPTKE